MKPAQVGATQYDARIRRADFLASKYPFATEIVRFYSRIAEFQKIFYADTKRNFANALIAREPGSGRVSFPVIDAPKIPQQLPAFLSLIQRAGPQALASAAHQIAKLDATSQRSLLHAYWDLGGLNDQLIGPFAQFIPRAFLQPLAELSTAYSAPAPEPIITQQSCPLCGGRPFLGVLRQEGDGGKRRMMCSFCLQEWDFRRIYCAACGEEDEKKLPVYVAEQFPHIRVEACDTCKTYMRTIDLTTDGNAVPIIDDLAAIPLTLWAQEHDYTRVHPNLLGT